MARVVSKLRKNILVTGGAGFIGSHVVDELIARGCNVFVLDDLSSGSIRNIPSEVEFIQGQVQTLSELDLPSHVDAVVHLAACASVLQSWQYVQELNDTNLGGTLAVIKWAIDHQVERIIFASSAAVYGLPQHLPIAEDASLQPISPYGLQKAVSEAYLKLFSRNGAFNAISLRFFNVYGERQSTTSDYAGVVSKFAYLIARDHPVEVYGDGSQTRDFVHVSDAVGSVMSAIEQPLEPDTHIALNVGTGCSTTVIDLVRTIENLTSKQVDLKFADARIGDIHHSVADATLADRRIGFRARTMLKPGLQRYLAWLNRETATKTGQAEWTLSS